MDPEEACVRIELLKGFVQMYEKEKQEIEELLRELNGIADGLDKVDRDCTIAKTAGSSAGVVGGVLTIVGIGLAPVTFGASLGLSIAGAVTAVAGGATNVGTQIVKCVSDGKDNNRVNEIVKIIQTYLRVLGELCNIALPECNWNKEDAALTGIVKTRLSAVAAAAGLVDAAVVAAAGAVIDVAVSPDAVADVIAGVADGVNLSGVPAAGASAAGASAVGASAGRVAAGLVDDVAPAVLKGAGRVVGGVAAGVFVVVDAVQIGLNAKKLYDGSPTERAQEIRKLVETVELQLAKLEEVSSDINNILNP
ncbi:apolipoprotein L5-like [Acipenser ruthenus]|nr:apolipoprotein L5-like [Acipenser ruthenus]